MPDQSHIVVPGHKPGDITIRRRRIKRHRLRRVLGVPALFSAGYGNVGSSIYYALGIVAFAAMGATPVALGIAGIFFVATALTYAEGTAMFPEAGGSASFARHGFNELVSFISGWALMLSYIVTIAISAFTIPPYLGFFWAPLKESEPVGTAVAMGLVLLLMVLNVVGVKETGFVNILASILDLTTQGLLVLAGLFFLFNFPVLISHMFDFWPRPESLVFGIAIASLAYTGVETVSQMAEETRQPEQRVPKALVLMTITVLAMFSAISITALSAMPPSELATTWAKDPMAGIAFSLPVEVLRAVLQPMVALLAATILLIATNAGLMGVSRLGYSMALHRQVPKPFGRIHPRSKTPFVSIIIFASIALVILVPGLFGSGIYGDLGALYVFGSLLAFALSHAAILALRVKRPELPRPFKVPGNIRWRGKEIPLFIVVGMVFELGVWVVLLVLQPYSRWVGLGWMALGLALYFLYRKRASLSLTQEAPKLEVVA
ncbi:MAG: APC family permease [Dehalococcoidia bacterium]|nr:APC family permease [Dehalococcoidia bacterium]